jgi:uncharacterized damage-inducible protein DinB
MDPLFTALFDRLEALHRSIENALEGLPDEALDWFPGPDMNSLGVLIAHTMGAERYWIGDVAGLEPSERVRETEFQINGVSVADFRQRSREVLAHSLTVLSRLSPDDLGLERTAPLFGQRVTVAWALAHALEHTALHTGHIEITRQLWDRHREESIHE